MPHPGGRPAKWDDEEQLMLSVESYFDNSDNKPTISGLAHHLGFESRQSVYDYQEDGHKFSYIIKRAVLFIESVHEAGLYNQSNSGHIFWLKNRGWSDKQEIEHSGGIENKVIQWNPPDADSKDSMQ